MLIQITARNVAVPTKLKSYIESKVEKLDKFLDGITDVHVTLSSEKFRQIAELNVHSRGSVYLSATEASEDLKSAVSQAIEKIEGQAKKRRAKKIDKKRRRPGRVAGEGTFNVIAGDGKVSAGEAQVIESRRFVVKPLTVEEAVLEIEGESAEFLVFRNAANSRTNVLYRRPDGNFGLIDPE
ncbi:MAG: ribosome-associated translation inhibitor RaiA [Acidobacteriota bacterium]|nr:MAG: ribosome-associated translation inhibitor RaiA [Acidobacteriota bacterium]